MRRSRSARRAHPAANQRPARLAVLLVVVCGVLAYANSIHGPFIFDDRRAVLENPTIPRVVADQRRAASTPSNAGRRTSDFQPVVRDQLCCRRSGHRGVSHLEHRRSHPRRPRVVGDSADDGNLGRTGCRSDDDRSTGARLHSRVGTPPTQQRSGQLPHAANGVDGRSVLPPDDVRRNHRSPLGSAPSMGDGRRRLQFLWNRNERVDGHRSAHGEIWLPQRGWASHWRRQEAPTRRLKRSVKRPGSTPAT